MNYEDFSSQEQKIINDFQNLIENVKKRKDEAVIAYLGPWLKPCLVESDGSCTTLEEMVLSLCIVARQAQKRNIILQFIHNKNYFLPTFSSYKEFEQDKHKYPFIVQ